MAPSHFIVCFTYPVEQSNLIKSREDFLPDLGYNWIWDIFDQLSVIRKATHQVINSLRDPIVFRQIYSPHFWNVTAWPSKGDGSLWRFFII